MSFKLLLSLISLGAVGTTFVGYSLLGSKENTNSESNIKDTIKNPQSLPMSTKDNKQTNQINEVTNVLTNKNASVISNLEKQKTFNGWLVFTINIENLENIKVGLSKLRNNNPHYYVFLLDNNEYKNWLEIENKKNNEDEEELTQEEKNTNFGIEVATKFSKEESKKYIEKLEEKFKSQEFSVRDKSSLKNYFEKHNDEEKLTNNLSLKDIFKTEISKKVLEKLKELEKIK